MHHPLKTHYDLVMDEPLIMDEPHLHYQGFTKVTYIVNPLASPLSHYER
jgi:hypothetical protein